MALALVRLAQIGRPHGLKGEVKAALTADDASLIEEISELWLERPNGGTETIELERLASQGDGLRLKFKGVDGRDAADALKGCALSAKAQDLPEPEEGSFWLHQIVGYRIVDKKRGELGELKSLIDTGANDCFEVQPQGRDSYLVPVTDQTFTDVDHEAKVVTMDLLEGSVPGEIEDED